MHHFALSLLLLLTSLVAQSNAFISEFGTCFPGSIKNGAAAATGENFAKIKGMGDLAVVAWDPTDDEKNASCVVLRLGSDQVYFLRYRDGSGGYREVRGSFSEVRLVNPRLDVNEASFRLHGLRAEVLNGGRLFPMFVEGNNIIFLGCRFGLPSNITTYLLVPLWKAQLETASSGCLCNDWRTA